MNRKDIDIGIRRIEYNGIDLGYTLGNVTVNWKPNIFRELCFIEECLNNLEEIAFNKYIYDKLLEIERMIDEKQDCYSIGML